MFTKIFFLVLFYLFFVFTQKYMQKKVKLYYENGNIKYIGFTIGDLYDGPGQLFSEKDNGTLLYNGNFTKGKKSGVGRENYENGTRKYYGNYTNDTYNGIGELYDGRGRIDFIGGFLNGKKDGPGTQFYKNGNKHHEGIWKNDTLNGKTKTYYQKFNDYIETFDRCEELPFFNEEQELIYSRKYRKKYEYLCYEGEYINGTMWGKGTFLYINEIEKYEGEWKNGTKNGYGLLRNKDGTPLFEGFFVNNVMTSGSMYDKDRNVYSGNFINNKLEGRGEIEFKKDWCYVKGYFSNGILNGTAEVWSKAKIVHQKILIGKFLNGILEGNAQIFFEEKIFYVYFVNGKLSKYYTVLDNKNNIDKQNEKNDILMESVLNKCNIFNKLASSQ